MTRVARSPMFLALLLVVLLGIPLWYASCMRTNTSLAAASPPSPLQGQLPQNSAAELEGAMLLAGLDPRALTAVGVAAQSMSAFVDAVRDAFAVHGADLTQAEARISAARVSSDALRRKIQGGKGEPEDVTAYQSALAELALAETAKTTALAACRAPAEATLSQAQRGQLARIRANKHWELPSEFLLVDRSEVQWVALRDALANEKIAPRYGDEVAPQHATVLASARANPDVALAKTRLDTVLTATQAAMHAALIE